MRVVDTHCHLQHEAFDEDREAVCARALEALEWVVVIGDGMAGSRKAVELAGGRIFAAAGVHPYKAAEIRDGALDELRQLAMKPGVVALGETGLDYYKYCDTPRDLQHEAFRQQLELAAELRLPVIIHNREAHDDCLAILREAAGEVPAVVMHCFSGDAQFAEQCAEAGYYISFAGNLTFPKAKELREAAAVAPLERLMVETDSPYLAPQPRRGKRCEPAFVQFTLEKLAELKGVSVDEMTRITSENAARFFNIA